MRFVLILACVFASLSSTAVFTKTAFAQSSKEVPRFYVCYTYESNKFGYAKSYIGKVFQRSYDPTQSDELAADRKVSEQHWREYPAVYSKALYSGLCKEFGSRKAAESERLSLLADDAQEASVDFNYGDDPEEQSNLDHDDASIKTVTLTLRGMQGGRTLWANVDLQYRFIECAGALHVAYAVKPKTIRYDGSTESLYGRLNLTSVHMIVDILARPNAATGYAGKVDVIDDQFAGDSLGMGCFDGQLHKVAISDMWRPFTKDKASYKDFVASLSLSPSATPIHIGNIGDFPDKRGEGSSSPAASAQAEAKAAASAAERVEAERQEAARASANAEQAKRAQDQLAANKAAKDAYDAALSRQQARVAEYERLSRIHAEEVEKARIAQEEYERQIGKM
ncbi:hypothetical protein HNO88_000521 [Novosphingobium chloroacetimidivorans]|uniref:Uncharacterized protein n=1 Tax=Novosphingobium chloroacetimidivorans TaxID=1428314 RepID=A0A7W7K7L4_9SPHN|nr:hypothetical protein [Novosphingobium chloroacetimidivorans]MBB4857214.1 hypothetical protein [Novosphingobium chloroacetimidivorans]